MKLIVEPDQAGIRLDVWLSRTFPDLSRSHLQKLIRDGYIRCSGVPSKANYRVREKEEIDISFPEPVPSDILPEDIPLDILYEDDDLLVVNKPKGMVVHPAPGHMSGTLVNALLAHCKGQLSGINGVLRPGIVHRIDRDTTGSLLVCKNDKAHLALAKQLEDHTINRKYKAIVCGNIKEDNGTVRAAIARSRSDRKKMAVDPDGREAVTHYHVLERFGRYTYIECVLETGRTHQIRVHMSSIRHPVLGDAVYGPSSCPFKLEGQTLHAEVIGFIHPSSGSYMEFSAPLPVYFETLLKRFRASH